MHFYQHCQQGFDNLDKKIISQGSSATHDKHMLDEI
jgi:hypothetical protein